MLPDPLTQPLTKADDWVGVIPGKKRSALYEAFKSGELPSIEVSGRIYVPTLQMLQRLGLAPDNATGSAATAEPPASNASGGRHDHGRTTAV